MENLLELIHLGHCSTVSSLLGSPLPPPYLLLSRGLIGWGMVASEAASEVAVVEHDGC